MDFFEIMLQQKLAGNNNNNTSNIIQGTFTLTSAGSHDIDIPYSGNGHIIAFFVIVKNGREDNSSWANLTQQYAFESWGMYKTYPNTAPKYTGSAYINDGGTRFNVYKGSSATSYVAGSTYHYSVYNNTDASYYDNTLITIRSKNKFSAYGNDSGRGFALNIEYEYIAVYSE